MKKKEPPMPEMLKASWEAYEKHVLPGKYGPNLKQDFKEAFMAGAGVLFGIITNTTEYAQEGDNLADVQMRIVSFLGRELHAFGEKVDKKNIAKNLKKH